MHWDYGWGMGFGFGWFLMIFFWVLIILGVVYLIKVIAGGAKREEKGETALNTSQEEICKGRDKQRGI